MERADSGSPPWGGEAVAVGSPMDVAASGDVPRGAVPSVVSTPDRSEDKMTRKAASAAEVASPAAQVGIPVL